MKKVPFYPNHEDNKHCMLAVYRSIFEYLLDLKVDWAEMEVLTGYKPLKPAWSLQILTYLADKSVDIKMVEPFDYRRYEKEGESYLSTLFNSQELNWQLKNSNILEIRPMISKFLAKANIECRRPTINDIDDMLDEGRLVFVTLDAKSLNDKAGYESHAILIFDKEDDTYIFHDPGLPAKPNRRELKSKVYEAMGADLNTSEVTGFKKK